MFVYNAIHVCLHVNLFGLFDCLRCEKFFQQANDVFTVVVLCQAIDVQMLLHTALLPLPLTGNGYL